MVVASMSKYPKTKAAAEAAADAETTTEEVLVADLAEAEAVAEADLVVNAAVHQEVAAAVLDPVKKVDLADAAKAVAADSDRTVLQDVQMPLNLKDSALEHLDVRNHLATAHVQDAPEKTNLGLLIFL